MNASTNININFTEFDLAISQGFVVVDFWAEWCQPCKAQEKIIIELLAERKQSFRIAKVNADDNRFLSKKLGIQQIPTLLFYQDGQELERLVGIQNKQLINNVLNKYLKTEIN